MAGMRRCDVGQRWDSVSPAEDEVSGYLPPTLGKEATKVCQKA